MDQTEKSHRRQGVSSSLQSTDIGGLSDRDLNNIVSDLLAKELASKKELKK